MQLMPPVCAQATSQISMLCCDHQQQYLKLFSAQLCPGASRNLPWSPSEALWSHPPWSQSLKGEERQVNKGARHPKRTKPPLPTRRNKMNHEHDVSPAVGGGVNVKCWYELILILSYPPLFLLFLRLTGKCFDSI